MRASRKGRPSLVSTGTRASLLCVIAALLSMDCALFQGGSPTGPIKVVVDVHGESPYMVRIGARRIGEAKAYGRTVLEMRRRGIAGHDVSVCVKGLMGGRTWRCQDSRLSVPLSVREIWIEIGGIGIFATVV